MRVFRNFDQTDPIRRPVVTIGSYDGVHLGHRAILDRLGRIAREREGESVVVTFDPHPRAVLGSPVQLLSTLPEKLRLLESAGMDNVIVVDFTREFSRRSPDDFVRNDLAGRLGLDTLLVGYNHHLGRDKEGDGNFLRTLADELGFSLQVMPQQQVGDHKVSSTVIRQIIAAGEVAAAAGYLGGPYLLEGRIGRRGSLGKAAPDKLLPPPGLYAVRAECPGFSPEPLPCRLRIGPRRGLSFVRGSLMPENLPVTVYFERKER